MNGLDAVVVGVCVLAAIGGWRLGFLARALSWVGLIAGLLVGVELLNGVVDLAGDAAPSARLLVATLFLVSMAALGQALGLGLGTLLRRTQPSEGTLGRVDRAAGAAIGAVGVLVFLWLLVPALATFDGWPARAVRESRVVELLERWAPDQPPAVEALGRRVAEAPFPEVFGRTDAPDDPGPPPDTRLDAATRARVAASTVKVAGQACSRIQEGSGFVAAPDIVVTNAHVVAGERTTRVVAGDGAALDATVVAFDPVRDLAVLRVPGIDAAPLPFGEGGEGTEGAVFGHPGGGALREAPARVGEQITAVGTDIYRTGDSRRSVYVLAADLQPGDSGGPLVDVGGAVVGVAFAIDPGTAGTAYALTRRELDPVLAPFGAGGGPQRAVDTGPCLVG